MAFVFLSRWITTSLDFFQVIISLLPFTGNHSHLLVTCLRYNMLMLSWFGLLLQKISEMCIPTTWTAGLAAPRALKPPLNLSQF